MNEQEVRDGAQIALALLAAGPIDTRDESSLAKLVAGSEQWGLGVPRPEQIVHGFYALTVRGLAAVAGHGIALSREGRLQISHAVDVAPNRNAAQYATFDIVAKARRCVAVQAPHPTIERLRAAIDRYASRAEGARA